MDAERWLVVGLGNPGPKYQHNRHNVGFMVVDRIFEGNDSFTWRPSQRFSAEMAVGEVSKRATVLVKPQTYMNLSGRSVAPLARFYHVPPERMIVVHDDVDLVLGRIKVKQGGGDAGHNGLRSLTAELGSSEYVRVRFGVGRPERGEVADYVLSNFRADEEPEVEKLVERAAKVVRITMTRGLREAMNRFNKAPKPKRPKNEAAAEDNGENNEPAQQPATTKEAGEQRQ
jgi:PTH1 family peptidyl-tRNA hydrolase